MHQTDYDYIFKILLIGDSAVGKSSLLLRFAEDIFTDSFLPTIGVDFKIRTTESAGERVKLSIWDTAGQERYKSILSSYYKGSHGIFLIFDITNHSSLEHIQSWMTQVQKYIQQDIVKFLIGNKNDLKEKRQVSQEEGKKFAQEYGMKYMQTSAKDGINIEQSFINLVIEMKKKYKKNFDKPNTQLKNATKNTRKATCC